jgi:hypothetical protein
MCAQIGTRVQQNLSFEGVQIMPMQKKSVNKTQKSVEKAAGAKTRPARLSGGFLGVKQANKHD